MSLYAVWPYLAIVTGALLILRADPLFGMIDGSTPATRDRCSTLDGLRGFLAFGVFGHHAVVTHEYLLTGVWEAPPSAFYALLGEVGVSLFFAITGFLFWGKLLKARGMMDWKKLYLGRLFRIAPVYLAAVVVMLLVVSARTELELREPTHALVAGVVRWLSLGILGQPDVNGYRNTGRLMAGVTWTLQYEWLYYFSLPLLAAFAKRDRHLMHVLAGLLLCLVCYAIAPNARALYATLFFCGMTAASLSQGGIRARLDGKLGLVVMLLCLAILFSNFSTVKGITQVLLLGIIFYIISTGNSFLGILTARGSRRLGEISYSVYLIHGLILTGIFSLDTIRNFALQSDGRYWLIVALCALTVLIAASASYALIERPGIKFGKKAASGFRWRFS